MVQEQPVMAHDRLESTRCHSTCAGTPGKGTHIFPEGFKSELKISFASANIICKHKKN